MARTGQNGERAIFKFSQIFIRYERLRGNGSEPRTGKDPDSACDGRRRSLAGSVCFIGSWEPPRRRPGKDAAF
jgi:hypothetical protein